MRYARNCASALSGVYNENLSIKSQEIDQS